MATWFVLRSSHLGNESDIRPAVSVYRFSIRQSA